MSEYKSFWIAACKGKYLNKAYGYAGFFEDETVYYYDGQTSMANGWGKEGRFGKRYTRKGNLDKAMQRIGAEVFINYYKVSNEMIDVHAVKLSDKTA